MPVVLFIKDFFFKRNFEMLVSGASVLLLVAITVFIIYLPSLRSDFVYDARIEILQEGFITSPSNLPAVLSLKVLNMKLMLGDRPGQLLYLMLIATICGEHPFGYHLCSNLLHAANGALLFVLLCRLIATDARSVMKSDALKAQLAAALASLIFALHPIAVESVSEVSYSSSLLVTFFTLLALLAATFFDPRNLHIAIITGSMGVFCAFASVMSKESGIATALALIVYWLLFRRGEAKGPWLLFCGTATAVTAIFLAARFFFAPPNPQHMYYIGGSFSQVFLIQPHIWVFMMSKLLWPMHLSADYTPENLDFPFTSLAFPILITVLLWQLLLGYKNRIGALGVAIYWAGLLTVSNFVPLYHFAADRFYYLPLMGFAMQLLALLLMGLRSRWGFYLAIIPCLGAILPLTLLTMTREAVFANESSLWNATLEVSPFSSTAHGGRGLVLCGMGRMDEGMAEFQRALKFNSNSSAAHNNLGVALIQKGQTDEALAQFQETLEINPDYAEAHNNLAITFFEKGQMDKAIAEYQKALDIRPNYDGARANLAGALIQKGRVNEALAQFQKSLEINPICLSR